MNLALRQMILKNQRLSNNEVHWLVDLHRKDPEKYLIQCPPWCGKDASVALQTLTDDPEVRSAIDAALYSKSSYAALQTVWYLYLSKEKSQTAHFAAILGNMPRFRGRKLVDLDCCALVRKVLDQIRGQLGYELNRGISLNDGTLLRFTSFVLAFDFNQENAQQIFRASTAARDMYQFFGNLPMLKVSVRGCHVISFEREGGAPVFIPCDASAPDCEWLYFFKLMLGVKEMCNGSSEDDFRNVMCSVINSIMLGRYDQSKEIWAITMQQSDSLQCVKNFTQAVAATSPEGRCSAMHICRDGSIILSGGLCKSFKEGYNNSVSDAYPEENAVVYFSSIGCRRSDFQPGNGYYVQTHNVVRYLPNGEFVVLLAVASAFIPNSVFNRPFKFLSLDDATYAFG
jgi:hypothetical protein